MKALFAVFFLLIGSASAQELFPLQQVTVQTGTACGDADQAAGIVPSNWACDKSKSADFDQVSSLPANYSPINQSYLTGAASPCTYDSNYPYAFDSNGLHMWEHLISGSNWSVSPYFSGGHQKPPFYIEYARKMGSSSESFGDTDWWLGGNSPDPVTLGGTTYPTSGAEIDAPEYGSAGGFIWAPTIYTSSGTSQGYQAPGGPNGQWVNGQFGGNNSWADNMFDGNWHAVGVLVANGQITWYLDKHIVAGPIAYPASEFADASFAWNWFTGDPGGCPQGTVDSWIKYAHDWHP